MGAVEDQLFQRFGREFPAGTTLFSEGDVGNEMYIVQTGLVQVSKRVRDVEKVIGRIGPGEFFGEMALLNDKPRNASAVAIEDARLLVVDSKTFETMIRTNIEIAVRLIRKLAVRLEESNEQIENLMLRDPASRVAHYLHRQAVRAGEGATESILVPIATKELAPRLGLRPDQVEEVIAKLVRARLVAVTPDGLQVVSLPELEKYLKFLEMKEKYDGG